MSPVKKRIFLIIALFVFFSGSVLLVNYIGLHILSVVRAYINGEGAYSKGQKNAVFYLHRYTLSHQESNFQEYRRQIAIPLGNQQARLALEKPQPDLEAARRGFIRAQIPAGEMDGMIRLYPYFHLLAETRQALEIWARGDTLINEVARDAQLLHSRITSGQYSQQEINQTMNEIGRLNGQLTQMQDEFSWTMHQAARRVQRMLFNFMAVFISSLLVLCGYIAARALKYIQESEEKYRILFEESHHGLFIASADGTITDLNPTGMRLLGFRDPTEIQSVTIFRLFAQQDEQSVELRQQLERAHQVTDWEAEIILHDGTRHAMMLNATVQYDTKGRITAYRGSIRDITERKRALATLKEQNAELKKINTELDNYVYRASHDLRAPLSSLLGLINITNAESHEEIRKQYLDLMLKSVSKLDRLIQNIINHSKNARVEVVPQPINFREMIADVLDDLHYMEGSKEVEKQISIEEEGIFYSDEFRVRIIFSNILSNAIRFRNPLILSCIRITIHTSISGATIRFEDNGLGIAPEYIDKIFDMFYRASVNSTGSGLGLYIVNEVITSLGGSIKVDSQVRQGTSFTVELPIMAPEPTHNSYSLKNLPA